MKYFLLPLSVLLLLAAQSCGDPSFTVNGSIEGADHSSVVLEKGDFSGRWIPVDSTRTGSGGKFSISSPAPGAPEIYRLAFNGMYVYLPVDSIETITVVAPADAFDTRFSLSGSPRAERMEKFEKELIALPANISADSLNAFKRHVYMDYIRNEGASVLSYYVLTKTRNGKILFDPDSDSQYYAAVATAFANFRPDDPRTKLLEQVTMDHLRRRNAQLGRQRVVEGEEIAMINISLPDETGRDVNLSDVAGHGRTTILAFSLMNEPQSPAINARLYSIVKATGAAIYQVSLDSDIYAWREAAANLPWTTVIDAGAASGQALAAYNVTTMPVYFIYNGRGELVERVDDIDRLQARVAAH